MLGSPLRLLVLLLHSTRTDRRALPSQRTINTNYTIAAMGRNKRNGTPKVDPPSPRRISTPTQPPRRTNETKGRSCKNPVATRNKNSSIDMETETDTEITTFAPTVQKIDKRLRRGGRPSLTPGK